MLVDRGGDGLEPNPCSGDDDDEKRFVTCYFGYQNKLVLRYCTVKFIPLTIV